MKSICVLVMARHCGMTSLAAFDGWADDVIESGRGCSLALQFFRGGQIEVTNS